MRMGILGGSFNPVHEGHLALASSAFSELNLDKLYFVPSCLTPLKNGKDLLSAEARLSLLKKALKPYPDFSISECEIERGGMSYTVDTLLFFKKKYPAAKLYFLTGLDSLESLPRWKSVDRIFKLCHFVVAARPGYRWEETKYPVLRMPFEALDVSATSIRRAVLSGKSLDGWVPPSIQGDLKKAFTRVKTAPAEKKAKKGDRTSKRRRS